MSPTSGIYWVDLGFINNYKEPQLSDLKVEILKEAHNTSYTIHPGGTKMYWDLRETF